jgi:hypothetical protein
MTTVVHSGRLSKQISETLKLPPFQYSMVVGLLLSDANISFADSKSKNALIRFSQSSSRYEYTWYLYFNLSAYCSSYPSYRFHARKGKINHSIVFFTRSLPCFTELYHLFIINNVKVIPSNIFEILTPVALANLIMGDGICYKQGGVAICTHCYSIPDAVRLMNVLMIKYGLICTLHMDKGSPRVYISKKSLGVLRGIVKPYLVPSMLYKIGL